MEDEQGGMGQLEIQQTVVVGVITGNTKPLGPLAQAFASRSAYAVSTNTANCSTSCPGACDRWPQRVGAAALSETLFVGSGGGCSTVRACSKLAAVSDLTLFVTD